MTLPSRISAFLIHLTASLAVALLVAVLVFNVWYPSPLDEALGVTHVFWLLILIDITVGPLLTLLVFDLAKKTLAMDLTLITCLQLAALGYGLWIIAEGRPAWIVFNIDRFDVVTAVDIDTRRIDKAYARYRNAPWLGPQWVGAIKPEDMELQNRIIFESAQGGSDIAQRPDLYVPLSYLTAAIRRQAQPLEKLNKSNESKKVRELARSRPLATAWVPLMARSNPMVVLLANNSNEILGVAKLKPW